MSVPLSPRAPKRPHRLEFHGETREDPWFWLRQLDDPATMEYLKAENVYTEAVMEPHKELQEALYVEMRGRIKEDDSSVPEKEGDYYYYNRFEEGAQYPIYCRNRGGLDSPEQVLLDVNLLAEGKEYLRVGVFKNSPDHRWIAYSVDTDGSERFTIQVKDLETGELMPDVIPNIHYSLEWADDNATFFYSVLDEHHRPVKVFRHRLGNDLNTDELVYEEKDPRFFVGAGKSPSRRFIYVVAEGNNMSEWYFLDADHPDSELRLIEPRQPDFEYDVVDHDEHFLIRHNGDGVRDFKVSETAITTPGKSNWKDFIPHEAGRTIRDVHLFKDYLAVSYRKMGLPQVQVMNLTSKETHDIAFDDEDYTVRVNQGREWDSSTLRFTYASLTTPPTVFDYDMASRDWKLRKQTEVLGGFSPEHYVTRRLWAPARDGPQVPVSLLYKKGIPLDGLAPLYLYGYGSYGLVMEADFGSARLSLVDRGFIFAVAHIRGGMEMGWDWYEQGKLLHKMNTFNDFIDCAEYLIDQGYASKGNIVAAGGSAGGLLVGAVANMRPDLFKAVVAQVPFVDILNSMLDDTLPLTTMEYNEWGNPQDKRYYDYIRSYAPYENVRPREYPHMLITGGISDPRVTYWEPTKWTARLRDLKTGDSILLLKINMDSGHGGGSGRFERLREVALEYAFILKAFGMAD